MEIVTWHISQLPGVCAFVSNPNCLLMSQDHCCSTCHTPSFRSQPEGRTGYIPCSSIAVSPFDRIVWMPTVSQRQPSTRRRWNLCFDVLYWVNYLARCCWPESAIQMTRCSTLLYKLALSPSIYISAGCEETSLKRLYHHALEAWFSRHLFFVHVHFLVWGNVWKRCVEARALCEASFPTTLPLHCTKRMCAHNPLWSSAHHPSSNTPNSSFANVQ